MEVSYKNCTNRVPLGVPICLPVFLVNNMTSFIITGMIKPEILGHVVQSFSRKWLNVHHILSFMNNMLKLFRMKIIALQQKSMKTNARKT